MTDTSATSPSVTSVEDLPQAVRDALTADELAQLTTVHLAILAILTDLDVHEEIGTFTDEIDDLVSELKTHGDDSGLYGAFCIARILAASAWRRYDYNELGTPAFSLQDETGDGGYSSFEVSVLLGADAGCHLADTCDLKYLDPQRRVFGYGYDENGPFHTVTIDGVAARRLGEAPELSPLRQALALAEVFCEEYERLRRKGEKLLGTPIPSRLPGTAP